MEHGELGISSRPATVFVFEDLIAQLDHPRIEQTALRLRRWELALDQWSFDLKVQLHMQMMIEKHEIPIDVITWHPIPFADLLLDRLLYLGVFVGEVRGTTYESASQQIATDQNVTLVYDADPSHRFGYGFKARDFVVGQL